MRIIASLKVNIQQYIFYINYITDYIDTLVKLCSLIVVIWSLNGS